MDIYELLAASIKKVIRGQERAIRTLLAGFLSGGHILLEKSHKINIQRLFY
jgi:MoxR-like ATPase